MTTVDKARTCCPTCNRRGKSVKAITIQSLVRPASLQRLTRHDGWRFCSTRKCATAYFNEALRETVSKAEVRVRIGQKETRAPRTVCYCFQHTDEEIEAEVREAGFSSVGDAIKAAAPRPRRCRVPHVLHSSLPGSLLAKKRTRRARRRSGATLRALLAQRVAVASDFEPSGQSCLQVAGAA